MMVTNFVDPRSIFDQVMTGQRKNFREISSFLTLQAGISKSIERSDIKHSLTCSPCSSTSIEVSFKHLSRISFLRMLKSHAQSP